MDQKGNYRVGMKHKNIARFTLIIISVFIFQIISKQQIVFADTSSSTNYQVKESSFNSGSSINSNSTNYNARVSFGDLAVGTADSANYNVRPGFINPSQEYLELVVQSSSVDLGTLSSTGTGSGTGIFYVRSYINGNYVVISRGQTLTSGPDSIAALSSQTASTTGTAQFGINLVANTTPSVGSDPSPDPNSTFANGIAATGYDTADQFKFVDNETVARSGSSGPAWGRTNFTISYIANISGITPAGTYTTEHDLILSDTF